MRRLYFTRSGADHCRWSRLFSRKGNHTKELMKKTTLQKKQSAKPASDVKDSPLDYFEEHKDEIVQTIQQLVEIESPSDIKQAVDRLGAVLAGRFDDLGGHTRFHLSEKFGNHLQVDFPGQRRGKPVLLLGHLDTVYPIGTLATMPCRIAEGRVWGPGTLDMKSGIALALARD